MLKWPDVLNLAKSGNPAPDGKVVKTDAEWREQLSDEEYHVTRQAGTERAFSSEMCSLFEPGIYSCLCCETVLFDASEKFESHTGWPSFTQPVKENVIAYRFDGPAPSGLRYCMNAVALRKVGSGCRCLGPIVMRSAVFDARVLDWDRAPAFPLC